MDCEKVAERLQVSLSYISLLLLDESVLILLRKVILCIRFFYFLSFNIFTTLFFFFSSVIYLRASLTISDSRLILIAYECLMNINCPAYIFILALLLGVRNQTMEPLFLINGIL